MIFFLFYFSALCPVENTFNSNKKKRKKEPINVSVFTFEKRITSIVITKNYAVKICKDLEIVAKTGNKNKN